MLTAYYYAFLAIVVFFWISNRLLVPKPLPGIPYGQFARWMPWGDLASLGVHSLWTGEVFDWLAWQCLKHKSPVTQILVPSFSMISPVLTFADIREVKDIIVRRISEIDRGPIVHYWFEVIVPFATTGMPTNASFKKQRRLWNCILNTDFLADIATPTFEASITRLIGLWTIKSEMAAESTFPAYQDLRRTTLEGIWKMLLGRELGLSEASMERLRFQNSQKSSHYRHLDTKNVPSTYYPDFVHDFTFLLTGLDWVVQGISPRIYKYIFNLLPPCYNALSRTKTMFRNFIEESRRDILKGLPASRCALDEVMGRSDDGVADEALTDEILELLITGHETTASTTAWGLKYLAKHQDVQTRLHDELKRAFSNAGLSNLPRASDLAKVDLPYLDAVLAEILRMSCTGPVLFRETIVDCDIMGHHVPARTPVFLVTQSPPGSQPIGPDTFEVEEGLRAKPAKPLASPSDTWSASLGQFVPERWLNSDGNFDSNAGVSLPFSAGRRGCFGRRIAMLELKLLISMLVLSFSFPRLSKELSRHNSTDSLTRRPATCFIKPLKRAV